ncbi:Cyanate hydratase [Marasmius tenuissimus]|uniref:Cyanate hydratase n=1 Tax=Marasmius tenuissimus TaxID=585030 RepID=A0ABR2ZR01_9AGAR
MHTDLFKAKASKNLTFAEIGNEIGREEVWVASAFYGQAKFKADELQKLAGVLDMSHAAMDAEMGDHWWPYRGLGPVPPTDPVIYRIYEGVLVYGSSIKAVVHEKFGDGIVSMIDCKIHIERKADPKGDRAVISFE